MQKIQLLLTTEGYQKLVELAREEGMGLTTWLETKLGKENIRFSQERALNDNDRQLMTRLDINRDYADIRRALRTLYPHILDRVTWWNTPYKEDPTRTPAQDMLDGKLRPVRIALGIIRKPSWNELPIPHLRIR